VEIVVPVRDEEGDLAPSIGRLAAYLAGRFPFRAVVTIADNGSIDGTWAAAQALAAELDGVRAVRLELPRRGRALRTVWSASRADVLAYMDVDLSTDLNALLPLVAPLLSGRQHPGSDRPDQAARARRGWIPVGRGDGRCGERGAVAACQRRAGHGDRRLQRHRRRAHAG
jgi:glycosyltransferase involved in cell wall biosynthesis